jgi:GT2 family glycosyltransferase
MGQASVSIIIPSRNSYTIDRTIDSLFGQTAFERIDEILVIGIDEPGKVVERGPVRFIPSDGPVTAPVARNLGIRQARNHDLVFIDADCVAEPGWLAELLEANSAGRPVVGGSVTLLGDDYLQLCYNLSMFHEFLPSSRAGSRKNLGTLNLFVSRQVVDKTGLMDESLVRCQDTEWTLRMRDKGYELFFEPGAVVRHLPHISGLSQVYRVWYRTGYFSGQIRRKYRHLIAPPPFESAPWMLALLSPMIGIFVTLRIFIQSPRLVRFCHTLPVIFLTKLAWCLGTSRISRAPLE